MNLVCRDFYEKFAELTISLDTVVQCRSLSCLIGAVFNEHFENDVAYAMAVLDGQIRDLGLLGFHKTMRDGERIVVKEVRRKFLKQFAVIIDSTHQGEPEEDSESNCRFPEAIINTNASVWLKTAEIGKDTMRLFASIKCVSFLTIRAPITEKTQKIIEIAVQKKTLNVLTLDCDHEFDEFSTKALLNLLKQDQFFLVELSEKCRLSLADVVAEWRHNSDKMVGKHLTQDVNMEDQLKSLGFTETELNTRIVLRGQGGRNVFADVDCNGSQKTEILFT